MDNFKPALITANALISHHFGFTFFSALLCKRIWRKKWLVLAGLLISIIAGILFTRFYPAVYQAKSTILLADAQSLSNTAQASTAAPRFTSLNAHVALLSSPDLQKDALSSLPLATRKKGFGRQGITHSITVQGSDDIITITVRAKNARAAAALANQLVTLYQEQDSQQRREEAARQRAYAEIARINAQQDFLRANKELSDFKAQSGLLAPNEQLVQFSAHLLALQEEAQRTRAAATAAEQTLRVLSSELKQLDVSLADNKAFSSNPQVANKLARLDQLTKERAELLKDHSADSPEVQQYDIQITDLEKDLQAQAQQLKENSTAAGARGPALNNYYATLVTLVTNDVKNKALQPAIAALKEEQKKLPAKAGQFAELQLAVTIQQDNLLQIENEFQLLSLREKSAGSTVRPGPPAITPKQPLYPNVRVIWVLFPILGLLFGIVLALLLERAGGLVTDREDAELTSHLPVLGEVDYSSSPSDELTGYRILRNNLFLSPQFADKKLLTIVNVDLTNGADEPLLKLATAMAIDEKKVLLVDGSLSQPTLHKLLGVENNNGLAEIINGQVSWKEAVVADKTTGVSLITAGNQSDQSIEALHSRAARKLLRQLAEKYDAVLIANPVAMQLSEIQQIASLVDGILLQVTIAKNSRRELLKLVTALRMINAPLLGLIIGNKPASSEIIVHDNQPDSTEEEVITP